MHIESIWQYPVKSMIGTEVPDAELAAHGMVNDRTWAIRDEERGGIRGAKKIGELMQFAATHAADGHVLITLPNGATVHSADADVHARLSAALQHEVTLWPLQAPTHLDHYRRGAPDSTDAMTELRSVFGRDEGEPLPDFSIFPPVIFEYESPPGTYLDAFPLMLMTTSALRSLATALPDSSVDVRRFRPSLVVNTGDVDGHPEFTWVGKCVRIGDVVLDIPSACPRCVMVTRAITADLPADRAVLRHIVRDLDQNVGVYATVVQPGVVRAGDTVDLL